MEALQKMTQWLDDHRAEALDLIRIYLGIGLFVRGLLFIADAQGTAELLQSSSEAAFVSAALIHYVALAHLAGGALLALGLLTRLAALVQLPILVGAVFLVHLEEGLLTTGQSLEFSALVLALLALISLFGAGRWSVDHYVSEHAVEEEPAAPPRSAREPAARRRAPERAPRNAPEPVRAAPANEDATPQACSCGHDRDHPSARVEVRYGLRSMPYFLAGITGPPKEVIFRCEECGEVIERSRAAAVLKAHRYR